LRRGPGERQKKKRCEEGEICCGSEGSRADSGAFVMQEKECGAGKSDRR
jgi:hypothetical protein